MDDEFSRKWKGVLASVKDQSRYADQSNDKGWKNLPTRDLPQNAHQDIKRYKSPVNKDVVLVINHGFSTGWLDFLGQRHVDHDHDAIYLNNLDRLLQEKDPHKVDTVMFDFPEYYVLDSRDRLISGQIQGVVLTWYDWGGSLFRNAALKMIGRDKIVYLAGSTEPCLSNTAYELQSNGNSITLLVDAAIHAHILSDSDLNSKA